MVYYLQLSFEAPFRFQPFFDGQMSQMSQMSQICRLPLFYYCHSCHCCPWKRKNTFSVVAMISKIAIITAIIIEIAVVVAWIVKITICAMVVLVILIAMVAILPFLPVCRGGDKKFQWGGCSHDVLFGTKFRSAWTLNCSFCYHISWWAILVRSLLMLRKRTR